MKHIGITSLLFLSSLFCQEGYVIGEVLGQMGNNLFQVATACSVAWDHGVEAYFPRLPLVPQLCHHVFSRCNFYPPSEEVDFVWSDPGHRELIPFAPKMKLQGYFQYYRQFERYRDRLVQLFAPSDRDLMYMQKKYKWLIDHPHTVGIQIRYWAEDPGGMIQYGYDYLSKAMALFPECSLFIISSNNPQFAKENIDPKYNVIYLSEPFYIEFYLLTFCKSLIISNSTFGWWAAWLNENPQKRVICPNEWWFQVNLEEFCPPTWEKISAKVGCIKDPNSYH